MIRKALPCDMDNIMELIKNVIAGMEAKGIYQWDSIYPNEEIIGNDIYDGNLNIFEEDEKIKGIIVLNEYQDKEYDDVDWAFSSGKQLVVHRLCVSPLYQGQGIAKKLMNCAEEYGRKQDYESIRLDTFADNKIACGFYEKLGYMKAGVVHFRKGKFYCFEKKL